MPPKDTATADAVARKPRKSAVATETRYFLGRFSENGMPVLEKSFSDEIDAQQASLRSNQPFFKIEAVVADSHPVKGPGGKKELKIVFIPATWPS